MPSTPARKFRSRRLAALAATGSLMIAAVGLTGCSDSEGDTSANGEATTSFSFDPNASITPCTGAGCGDESSTDEAVVNTNPEGWDTPVVPDRAKTEATKERYNSLTPTGSETQAPEVSDELRALIDGAAKNDPDDPLAVGPIDAPVVVQVYMDYQCPYCAGAAMTIDPVLKEAADNGEVRIEYNNYPVLGEHSVLAALGSIAAAGQGKFMEYHDYIFAALDSDEPVALDFEGVVAVAEAVGVADLDTFRETMMSQEAAAAVVADATTAIDDLGIRYVPAYFVGYSFLDIEGDAQYARHAIDLELERAGN